MSTRQSNLFLAAYALAAAGGSASYAPFLTVILPARISQIAGASWIETMSYAAFVGAVAASLANILFGWLSDRTGNRRGWIVAGVALSGGLLVAMPLATTVSLLLLLICLWQIALNMMLNPLAALAGDYVPDEQKGLLGGLLAFSPGIGALVGALVTLPGFGGTQTQLVAIAAFVAAMVLPLAMLVRPRPMPQLMVGASATFQPPGDQGIDDPPRTAAVWRMWIARLGVQVAEASLFAFLLLWLRGIDRTISENDVATIFTVVLFASVPIAIVAGRLSDRARSPLRPLVAASGVAAMGLVGMAASTSTQVALLGYLTFGTAAAVFLALHSSQTLRVLPRPEHRGRDLGYFNLTNTVPSLIMPSLTLALIPLFGFPALFAVLACVVALAAVLLATAQLR